jgi:23S rRNA pseudouridine2457 synthase
MGDLKLYMLNKPFGLLSQFSDEGHKRGLGSLKLPWGKDIYSVGRLDADSEGLLLLTNNNRLKTQLLDPDCGHERTYHVQVEGMPTEAQLQELRAPLQLRIKGKSFHTRGARAQVISPEWPDRIPPIRVRKTVPDAWLELTLTEGKNRQVRRMTAAVGLPTLRLIRVAMGPWKLDNLAPGEWQELNKNPAGT